MNIDDAIVVAEKLRSAIEELWLIHEFNAEGGNWVTVSIGGTTVLSCDAVTMRAPEHPNTCSRLRNTHAKKPGRNRAATAFLKAYEESL